MVVLPEVGKLALALALFTLGALEVVDVVVRVHSRHEVGVSLTAGSFGMSRVTSVGTVTSHVIAAAIEAFDGRLALPETTITVKSSSGLFGLHPCALSFLSKLFSDTFGLLCAS